MNTMQVKVVKAVSAVNLEERINEALNELAAANIVDIKVSGAGTDREWFIAVIMYTM